MQTKIPFAVYRMELINFVENNILERESVILFRLRALPYCNMVLNDVFTTTRPYYLF